jgi:hypothetical protein
MRKGKDLDQEPVPDPYFGLMDPDPGRQKHSDPDPQHCFTQKYMFLFCSVLWCSLGGEAGRRKYSG